MNTLSGSVRSRPAANAWRKAASENETARPISLAKVAARIAISVLPGQRLGPADRRQPVGLGAALDLAHARLALGPVRPRVAAEALEQAAEQDRLPLGLLGPGLLEHGR